MLSFQRTTQNDGAREDTAQEDSFNGEETETF